MNKFFNSKDKRKSRHECINNFCVNAIKKQKEQINNFKKKPNQILIRDCDGKLKQVSKIYYLYHIKDDEYDTELEIED